jgi:hypothetical protein
VSPRLVLHVEASESPLILNVPSVKVKDFRTSEKKPLCQYLLVWRMDREFAFKGEEISDLEEVLPVTLY